MKNSSYNSHDVKIKCESKLDISFRSTKESNGWYYYEGKKVVRVTVPMGKKYLPYKTYKSIATQLKLTVDEFDQLLDCPLNKEKYDKILKKLLNSSLGVSR